MPEYLVYGAVIVLAMIVGALISAVYLMMLFAKRLMRHNYVCTSCGDSFRAFIMGGAETAHTPTDDNVG